MKFLLKLFQNLKKIFGCSCICFCPDTIQAASCSASSQLMSLAPASSGSVAAVSSSPPLHPLYDSTYAVLCWGPRAFTLQVRPREEIIAVSHLKA
jgi:hypothetical protein